MMRASMTKPCIILTMKFLGGAWRLYKKVIEDLESVNMDEQVAGLTVVRKVDDGIAGDTHVISQGKSGHLRKETLQRSDPNLYIHYLRATLSKPQAHRSIRKDKKQGNRLVPQYHALTSRRVFRLA